MSQINPYNALTSRLSKIHLAHQKNLIGGLEL